MYKVAVPHTETQEQVNEQVQRNTKLAKSNKTVKRMNENKLTVRADRILKLNLRQYRAICTCIV